MNQFKTVLFRSATYLLLIFSSSLTAANSLIFETNQLSDIKKHLEEDVLVILDIDNTLCEPVQSLGSDQWAWSRVKELKNQGLSEQEAFRQTMVEWREVHSITKVKTLEENAPAIIQELQERGYPLIALTTRSPEDAVVTLRELHQIGIDLTPTAVIDSTLDLPLKGKAQFSGGILFASLENKKGMALKEFLNRIGYHPLKVIFVDDKLSHVKDVEEACLSQDINYIGIRYGAADKHVAAFDPDVAELQKFFLHHILSDDQAALLQKGPKYE